MVVTSPAFARNKEPILRALRAVWPETGRVLEVGSGPGQHIALFAETWPGLSFVPCEKDRALFASIAHHVAEAGVDNVTPPRHLDLDDARTWPAEPATLDAMVAINVLHVVGEDTVERFFTLAGRLLKEGGTASVYECFIFDDRPTAQSNLRFDAWLRARYPGGRVHEWNTVRAFAERAGLEHAQSQDLPSNNLLATFVRRAPAG